MSPSGKRQRRIRRRQGKRGEGDRSIDSSHGVLEGARGDSSWRTSTGSMDNDSLLVLPERKRFIFDYMGEETCRGILAEGRAESKKEMASIARRANRKDRRSLSSLLSLDGSDDSVSTEEPTFSCFGKEDGREILRAGWKYAEAQMAADLKKAREKRIEARRMRARGGDRARNEPASEKISDLKDRIRQLERLVKLMKQKAAIQEQQTAVQEKINAQLMAMVLGED